MKKYTSFKSIFTSNAKMRKAFGRQIANMYKKNLEGAHAAMNAIVTAQRQTKDGLTQEFGEVTLAAETAMIVKHIPITHYFVDPGVAEFCAESVKQLHRDYYRDFNFDRVEAYSLSAKAALFHLPAGSGRRSIMVLSEVRPTEGYDIPGMDLMLCDGDWTGMIWFQENGEAMVDSCNTAEMLKLVMGLSLYMESFPDAIKNHDGTIILSNKEKCKARTLSVSDDMREEITRAVSPHWRRGHFRILRSDRYKEENRGSSVFVKGTFVKGKAFDIKSDAPATA